MENNEKKEPEAFPKSRRKISRSAVKAWKKTGIIALAVGVIAAITCLAVIPNLPKAEAEKENSVVIEGEDSIIMGQGQEGRSTTEFSKELSGHIASNKAYAANLGVVGNKLIMVYYAKEDTTVSAVFKMANTISGTTSCTLADAILLKSADMASYKANLADANVTDGVRELSLKSKTLNSPCDGTYYDSWAELSYGGIPVKAGFNVFAMEVKGDVSQGKTIVNGVPNVDCVTVTGMKLSEHKHTFVTKVTKEATDYDPGISETYCSDCLFSEGEQETSALGHTTDWGQCTRCKDFFYYYEAEDAVFVDTGSGSKAEITTNSIAHGGKGLDYLNGTTTVTFTVTSDKEAAGVTFQLALASNHAKQVGSNWYQDDMVVSHDKKSLIVKFDGTDLPYNDLALTGSQSSDWWTNIGFLKFNVDLSAGKNTIVVTSPANTFPNFDYIQFLNVPGDVTLTK